MHLRRPWARPDAFSSLLSAFRRWAPRDRIVGWTIGDSLASAAEIKDLDVLLELVEDRKYSSARQMLVESRWRFCRDPRVGQALERLIEDPDVSLHAMSALRRAIGIDAALPSLRRVRDGHPDEKVRRQASRAVWRAEKTLPEQQQSQS
jgi:hypothetical protein